MKKITEHSLFLGLMFFTVQLALILLISPQKSMLQSWLDLARHWDSEWYAAIAQYGYINIDGPLHTGLRNANVVFFPGYPYLARGLVLFVGLDPLVALLVVSQSAALLFWCLVFYILRHVQWRKQLSAALMIMVFPTSWFLFMGYAESCFMVMCFLMLWFVAEKRWIVSGMSGAMMTATRLIGIPVLAAPLFAMVTIKFSQYKEDIRARNFGYIIRELLNPGLLMFVGGAGCVGFFMYCAIHFGSWHLYFDMEKSGWNGSADPLFFFKLPTWLPPPWGYKLDLAPVLPNAWAKVLIFDGFRLAAYTLSEMLVPIFLWLLLLFFLWVFKRPRDLDQRALTWYFAAVLLFLFTCLSLSTRYYESMSRCLFPVWALLMMADALHPKRSLFFPSGQYKLMYVPMMVMIVFSAGYWVELLNRFLLGWWVA